MSTTASARKPPGDATVRIVPFAVFVVLLGLEPYIAAAVEPVLDPRWLYAIRSGITLAVLVAFWKYYGELRRPEPATPAAWLLGVGAGVGVFLLWIALNVPPFVIGDAEGAFDPRVDGTIHLGLAITRVLGSALVVPIIEELFWRSFLMRWLHNPRFLGVDPASVGWKPLLLTSAVFALEHRQWLAGLLAGLVYGELYRRTRSIWIVILAHALTNALLGLYVLWTGEWSFW